MIVYLVPKSSSIYIYITQHLTTSHIYTCIPPGRALALEIEKIGDYSLLTQLINPTTVLAGRGSTNTTKRDLSGFEYVQKKEKKLNFNKSVQKFVQT
jgi:hypothetical protein